jgi:hypothetical protein
MARTYFTELRKVIHTKPVFCQNLPSSEPSDYMMLINFKYTKPGAF